MIRFVYFFNYGEGVSLEEGDRWYRSVHVPAVREIDGVVRYRSWPCVDVGLPYPSPGIVTPLDQFVRRSELVFASKEQGLKAIRENVHLWAVAEKGEVGFNEVECVFLEEEPQYNLLRDAPPEHYKYMTLPLHWPSGRPEVDEEEIFILSYCFHYVDTITFANGEDWYLGHHTREGKQLPGMKHYKTWRSINAPELEGTALKPNKWVRLTELGMSPSAFRATMIEEQTRLRFTASVYGPIKGGVLGGWMNISIKLHQVEDLLVS